VVLGELKTAMPTQVEGPNVKAITEELCGHRFSASSISTINKRLDQSLAIQHFPPRPIRGLFE
jgi:transposase-like protein